MKILCISDDKDVLVYSPNIASRYSDVDIILSAGDLPLKYYEYIVSSLNKPFYFIFGNHHTDDIGKFKKPNHLDEFAHNVTFDKNKLIVGVGGDFIDGKVIKDKKTGLLIAGLGGSMRYNKGEHQFTEVEMALRILFMLPHLLYNRLRYKRFLDILLTHAAPYNVGDAPDMCHRGFKVFLWFMKVFKPRYLLHGHIHLIDHNANRETQYLQTKV
ncbi:MAG: metallophosphoesterase, partial [Spirochaetia bacterium]|nr:metallophosphoesterase [Spirochaetia bacterium]